MNKVAIVYWSGTGNTEQMAQAVAEGVKNAGGEADVLTCAEFDSAKLADYGAVAFGSGQWLEDWCARCKEDGAVMQEEPGVMANEAPDDDAIAACNALGAKLAVC